MSLYDFADICAVLPEHLSCARYEVMIDGKSQYFKRLSDAVKCFNGG